MKTKHLLISFTLGLGLALGLLWLMGGSLDVAQAQSGTEVIRVDTDGTDALGCGSVLTPCKTIQYAVDQASTDDVIKVAAGNYTGVQTRTVPAGYPDPPLPCNCITQVVYISKPVTVRGGYTTTNWDTPDPETNLTTLDAQGKGRVLVIAGTINPTVEGLHITDGDATGLGGGSDVGGGVYVISATATIRNNRVFSNTAATYGGGLLLENSAVTLNGNTVYSNTAGGNGGGLLLENSAVTLTGNTVYFNTATYYGGGLLLKNSAVTLTGNTVYFNTATYYGGGLLLENSAVTLTGNTIFSNTADYGGGVFLENSAATLNGNTIFSNTAATYGGGLLLENSAVTLNGNTIFSNTADYGGGVFLENSAATLNGNTVYSNTAGGSGGGVYLFFSGDATLTGNTVISNTAGGNGGGLYLQNSDSTLNGNTVYSNTAGEYGGGLFLYKSGATISGNRVISNTAGGNGGGLFLYKSGATISGNRVISNTAGGNGGGLYLQNSDSTLNGNTVYSTADYGGGGLLLYASAATISGNTVYSNTAGGSGGGLYLQNSDSTLNGNTVYSNTAGGSGGGLYLEDSDATLANNVVADNRANGNGSGLYIDDSSPHLLHTTIARNTGGSGVYVATGGTVAMTNTILFSHTVGITVATGCTATLESTLWDGNGTDSSGNVIHTNDHTGDPAFTADGYHIGAGSAALDEGINAGVTTDIDGDPRPLGPGYDLGADEWQPPSVPQRAVTIHGPAVSVTNTVGFYGIAPANSTVEVSTNSTPTVIVTTTASASGHWSAVGILPNGTHTITARAVEPDQTSDPIIVIVDPTAVSIGGSSGTVGGETYGSGESGQNHFQVVGSVQPITITVDVLNNPCTVTISFMGQTITVTAGITPCTQVIYTAVFTNYDWDWGTHEVIVTAISCGGTPVSQMVAEVTLIDPSGYVYNAFTAERIQGATVTCYYSDTAQGQWVVWEAALYNNQLNPQTTDATGWYGFMVPAGDYYVAASKAGYADNQTIVYTIPPEVTDAHIPLTPLASPPAPVGGTTLVRPFDPFWPYGVYLRLVLRSY